MISISSTHPLARYCERCKSVGDVPLCLLRPSVLERLLKEIPPNNFHRIFWTKPPPHIEAEGKTYTSRAEDVAYESIARYLSHELQNEIGYSPIPAASDKPLGCTASSGDSSETVRVGVTAVLQAAGAKPRKRRNSLFVGGSFIAPSYVSSAIRTCSPERAEKAENSSYVHVSASVLLAYCIVRSWNIGKKWTGSRTHVIIGILAALSYLIPSFMRAVEVCLPYPLFLIILNMVTHFFSSPSVTVLGANMFAIKPSAPSNSPCSLATMILTLCVTFAGSSRACFGIVCYSTSLPFNCLSSNGEPN
jgi:hypothetical protein